MTNGIQALGDELAKAAYWAHDDEGQLIQASSLLDDAVGFEQEVKASRKSAVLLMNGTLVRSREYGAANASTRHDNGSVLLQLANRTAELSEELRQLDSFLSAGTPCSANPAKGSDAAAITAQNRRSAAPVCPVPPLATLVPYP